LGTYEKVLESCCWCLKWRWREEGEDERKNGSFTPVKSGGGGGG